MTERRERRDTDRDERVRQLLRRRRGILGALLDEPLTKRSLVERVDLSRSTVDRALKTLTARGLVRRDGEGVVASAAGRLAYESVERYRETTAEVARTTSLLGHLPADAAVDADLLAGATIPPVDERPGATGVSGCAVGGRGCRHRLRLLANRHRHVHTDRRVPTRRGRRRDARSGVRLDRHRVS